MLRLAKALARPYAVRADAYATALEQAKSRIRAELRLGHEMRTWARREAAKRGESEATYLAAWELMEDLESSIRGSVSLLATDGSEKSWRNTLDTLQSLHLAVYVPAQRRIDAAR